MKETTKRLLSLVLCFVMVVGLMPALSLNASAAENVIDAAIFCSDVHGSTSDLTSVLSGVKTSGENYSAIGFVGDTCLTVANTTSIVQTALSDENISVMFSYASSHDTESGADIATNWDYSGEVEGVSDNYLVYTIRETDMQYSSNANTAAAAFTAWYSGLTAAQKTLPIFVMSHRPLHARRGGNQGGEVWTQAFNAAGATSDIVVFWAHNHTGETSTDTGYYYVEKGDTVNVATSSCSSETANETGKGEDYEIAFTYMNAGYINANGQNPARKGIATTVQITADSLIFQDYNSSGAYTGTYAHNVTVARTETSSDSGDSGSTDTTTPSTEATDPSQETTAPTETTTPSEGTTEGNVTDHGTYNEVTLGGTTTATKTKTVYLLYSGNPSGTVLIADANTAGTVHLVANDGGDLSTTTTTVIYGDCDNDGDSEYYIELTDATNELWTVSNSYRFQNDGYYLHYSNGLTLSSRNYTTWSYSSNRVSCSVRSGRNTYTYYLQYSSDWTASSTQANVYFYVPTEVEYTEIVDSTVKYTMRAEDLEQVVTDTNKTAALSYGLQGNGADLTTLPSGGEYTFRVLEDENTIISSVTDGTVNFTGNTGSATVEVAYTWTQDGETYTVYKNITVTASEPYYELDLHKANIAYTAVTGDFDANATYFIQKEDGTYEKVSITAFEDGVTYYTVTATVGDEITAPVALKGIEAGDRYGVWAVITGYDGVLDSEGEDGSVLGDVADGAIEWSSSDPTIATVDPATGIITFTGKEGTVQITADYAYGTEGKIATDTITISVTASKYTVPADGTGDFPEYPNEGAIRFDKTAQAVGNFAQTGIAQVELSMTGVPYTTGSEVDVVLMLDMTGSMDDVTSSTSEPTGYVRVDATIAASKAFIGTIVKNEDGSYNGNRVGVYVFNKNGAATLFDFGTVDSETELNAIYADLESIYDDHYASGGTPYDDGLAKCQEVLAAAKTDGIGNNRQQFTIFMTDGVPTSYAYVNGTTYGTHSSASAVAGMLTSSDDYATRDTDYKYEYYSTEMKKAGVTVYTVGVGLENTNNAWSGTATQCLNLASALLNDISGPGGEVTQPDAVGSSTHSKQDQYFFSVEDATAATDMEKVFTNIAVSILQAATDVTVEDQITKEYTMIFGIPKGSQDITGVTDDFYIEFVKYALDSNHERTTSTTITKLYLIDSNGTDTAGGTYSAGSSATTAYDAPVFEAKTIGDKGTLYYWTTDVDYASKAAVTYTNSNGTYYFIPYGMEANEDGSAPSGWYNMTSGAYASGTIDSTTNMSTDLVIATPYFVYNAKTKMLYWTVDKLDTNEYALRYFLYLDNSATEVATDKEIAADTYPTNHHAYITYTNFADNDCRQVFPIPQLTWNGAQVSYVFYLVNEFGQPINKSGQEVDFANATFITEPYTTSVVWNKGEDGTSAGTGDLSIDWLAEELLPENYTIYDEAAGYKLSVYEKADGTTIKNEFTISGGTAKNICDSLNSRLSLTGSDLIEESEVSLITTKVYNTKAGRKVTGYGTYYSSDADMAGFDFANTTVAFAVVWKSTLVPDTVVVDYGLDVLINVVQNDLIQNTVSGIGISNKVFTDADIPMNDGLYNAGQETGQLGTASLTTAQGNTISIEGTTQIRFHQNDMCFETEDVFYYESPVEYYETSEKKEGFMYSSVTVIPATTIYYEDSFVTYRVMNNSTWEEISGATWETVVDGSATTGTQAQDRPGKNQISKELDADNMYGYDSAYTECSMYSLGSARKVNVNANQYAEAIFTFWGTGFDVISMTSNKTGTITVDLYDPDLFWNADGTPSYNGYQTTYMVDTYYGYTYENDEWKPVDTNSPNALYQVPVMSVEGLDYDKYTVVITAAYNSNFDHEQYADGSYDFYLDAIRIYDPANDGVNNQTIQNAYKADGEGWPAYTELRNLLITAQDFNAAVENNTEIPGIIFIDGNTALDAVADYISYGPNNELYLAPGQAVAFQLNAGTWNDDGTLNKSNIASVQLGMKSVGVGSGTNATTEAKVRIGDTDTNVADMKERTVKTATDMYYDITDLNGKVVVIKNSGSANDPILSITNLKVTFKSDPQQSDLDLSTMLSNVTTVSEPVLTLAAFSLRSAPVQTPEETEPEETVPETTVPEETEPEETEPEETEPEETEPEVFQPKLFKVSVNKKAVKVGQKVQVTITTSTDVDYLTINGEVVTAESHDRNGVRTWRLSITAKSAGVMDLNVVCWNESGVASEAVTESIHVKNKKG